MLTILHPGTRTGSRSGPPYATLDDVWVAFEAAFDCVSGLIFYEPIHTAYVEHAIDAFVADGIQILEVRHVLQGDIGLSYNIDGTQNTPDEVIAMYQRLSDEAVAAAAQRPRGTPGSLFSGVRVIICGLRMFPEAVVASALVEATRLYNTYPDVVAGFDLVGQEDKGKPLTDWLNVLADHRLPLFVHAGETAIVGGEADMNLIDAVLLGTSRIGHGYALAHHAALRSEVKRRGIGVEVCPLSNQVLMLVDDLRNHPMQTFISEGLPVTISPDDPAHWGANGVSYDWAAAYVSFDSRAGLATLKQLALNSIVRLLLLASSANCTISFTFQVIVPSCCAAQQTLI